MSIFLTLLRNAKVAPPESCWQNISAILDSKLEQFPLGESLTGKETEVTEEKDINLIKKPEEIEK